MQWEGLIVGEQIGGGGQGSIWQAWLPGSRQPVALKVLDPSRAATPLARAQFMREVQSIAALHHPNVIPIFDHGVLEEDTGALPAGSPWLMMPLAEDGSLRGWLRGRALAPAAVRSLLLDVLAALGHVHSRGLVHRDLKPANLLAGSPTGGPWLLADLGIAVGQADRVDGSASSAGTPPFMAPEQITAAAGAVGPWTDLYALGCLAFAVITGSPPFTRRDFADVLQAQLYSAPPQLGCDPALAEWLACLLAKAPGERFQTAADASAALRALPRSVFPSASSVSATWPAASATLDLSATIEGGARSARPPAAAAAAPRPAPLPVALPPRPDPLSMRRRPPGVGRSLHGLREIPFLGREEELAALWQQLTRAAEFGRPQCALIRGPSGRGKTRLARRLAELAHEYAGAAMFTARFSAGGAPALEAVFPTQLSGSAEPADLLRQVLRGGRPGVVVLDDIHRAPGAVSLAQQLLAQPGLPVLILLIAHEEQRLLQQALDKLARFGAVEVLPLEPLPEPQWQHLIETLMGFSPPLAAQLARRTAGDPTLATQLVDGWLSQDALAIGPDGLELDPARGDWSLDAGAWQQTLLRALGGPPAPPLALAATLGVQVDPGEWHAACAAWGCAPAWEPVERLAAAGLVELRSPRQGWAFVHARAREAVRSLAAQPAALHRACAAALDGRDGVDVQARRGRHLHAAGDLAACLVPLQEGTRAVRRQGWGAESAALLGLWQRALSELGVPASDPRRAPARIEELRQGITRWTSARCLTLGEQLIEDCDRFGWERQLSEALFLTTLHTPKHSDITAARLDRAIACAPADDPDWLARLLARKGWLAALRSDDAGESLLRRALHIAGDHETRGLVSNYLSRTLSDQGRSQEALTLARQAAALYREDGRRAGLASALTHLGHLEHRSGDLDAAERSYRESLVLYRVIDPSGVLYLQICLGRIALLRADYDGAMERFEAIYQDPWIERRPSFRAHARLCRLPCLAARGEWDTYDAEAAELLPALGPECGFDNANFLDIAGDTCAAQGKLARARAAWARALAGMRHLKNQAQITQIQSKLDAIG